MAKATLNRSLGLGLVVVVVISNIVGSGIYKKVAPMAAVLHSPGWVLLCWILAGVITLFGALCNAEVAGLLADTGGEFAYYKKIYNSFFAFQFGWSLFTVIQTAAISSLAYVFAQSLESIFHLPPVLPSLSRVHVAGVFYPFADLNIKLTAIALIVLLTWINIKGIKTGAWFTTAVLVLVFAGIALIIGAGLTSNASTAVNVLQLQTSNHTPVTFSSVFTAMLSAFWAYQGWAGIGYIGGEVKQAHRNIPKGIAIGVFIVIALYLLVNITYLSILPISTLEQIHKYGNKIAAVEVVRAFWGPAGALFMSSLVMITTLGGTNATILLSSRPYFAMAREGLFFRKVGELNKHQAPAVSLRCQGVWACLLVFSGTFDQLTDMIIFAVFIYYAATTLGVFILRKKMPDAPRPYKVWGYPIVPAIVVLFCLLLLLNTLMTQPREAIFGTLLMLTGVPMYWWFKRGKRTQSESNKAV